MTVVYKSNGAKVGDGMRITRVSGTGAVFEVWTGAAWSEVEAVAAPVPAPAPVPTPPPAPAPVPSPPIITGWNVKSLAELQTKMMAAKGGEDIVLKDAGDFSGAVGVYNAAPASKVRIIAETKHLRPVGRLTISGATKNFTFEDVLHLTNKPNTAQAHWLVRAEPTTSNIEFLGCKAMGRDDAENYLSWVASDWLGWKVSGFWLRGPNSRAMGCEAVGVDFGFIAQKDGTIEGCTVRGYNADAFRLNGDGAALLYSRSKDAVKADSNHDDGVQGFVTSSNPVLEWVKIIGNTFLGYTGDPANPIAGTAQGIGFFDGPYADMTIEDNYIESIVPHGIAIAGCTRLSIQRNRVLGINQSELRWPWIKVSPTKGGMPSTQVIVKDNEAPKFDLGSIAPAELTASGNIKPDYSKRIRF